MREEVTAAAHGGGDRARAARGAGGRPGRSEDRCRSPDRRPPARPSVRSPGACRGARWCAQPRRRERRPWGTPRLCARGPAPPAPSCCPRRSGPPLRARTGHPEIQAQSGPGSSVRRASIHDPAPTARPRTSGRRVLRAHLPALVARVPRRAGPPGRRAGPRPVRAARRGGGGDRARRRLAGLEDWARRLLRWRAAPSLYAFALLVPAAGHAPGHRRERGARSDARRRPRRGGPGPRCSSSSRW